MLLAPGTPAVSSAALTTATGGRSSYELCNLCFHLKPFCISFTQRFSLNEVRGQVDATVMLIHTAWLMES